jgi:aryl-alcohol dehydrogenase-like predicted oxidoreductase
MRYRNLGRTGIQVSEIGHGLWGMGGWSGSTDRESLAALQLSLENGCNFYDTAWAYGAGKSDGLLGKLIRNNPEKRIYAASKIPPKNLRWPARSENKLKEVFPREHVLEHAEKIRKKLGTEKIDLLQYHVWDDSWADDPEFRATVTELKSSGLIAYFGLSLNRWEPANGIRAVKTGLVDTVQVIYNIFDQAPEEDLLPLCRELKVGVIARVPLDEGSLSGNLRPDTRFPEGDWRARYFGPDNLGPTLERIEKLRAIMPGDMTLPEMALRFILSNPQVSTTIVGMRKPQHVLANTRTSDRGPLPGAILAQLKAHRWDRHPADWAA